MALTYGVAAVRRSHKKFPNDSIPNCKSLETAIAPISRHRMYRICYHKIITKTDISFSNQPDNPHEILIFGTVETWAEENPENTVVLNITNIFFY